MSKEEGTCKSHGCEFPAAVEVFWPGRTLSMCLACAGRAKAVSEAMGFPLDVRPLAAGSDGGTD